MDLLDLDEIFNNDRVRVPGAPSPGPAPRTTAGASPARAAGQADGADKAKPEAPPRSGGSRDSGGAPSKQLSVERVEASAPPLSAAGAARRRYRNDDREPEPRGRPAPPWSPPRTAGALLALLEPNGPAVEGEDLVFATPPEEWTPSLELLHTGLRAQLAGKRWYGCDGETGEVVELRPGAPIPAGVALLCVEGDSSWDRICPAGRGDATESKPKPSGGDSPSPKITPAEWWTANSKEVWRLEDDAYEALHLAGVSGRHHAVKDAAAAFNAAVDAHDVEAVRRAAAELRAVVAAIRNAEPTVLSSSPCI